MPEELEQAAIAAKDEEEAAPVAAPTTTTATAPYSAFSKTRRRCIVLLIAVASAFSPLSSFIYYPATQSLADDLNVSVGQINLGITTYMIVSGITPSFVGDLADQIGRRSVYIGALIVYFGANVGLALQSNYAALLVLRALQSAGSSGTIAIAYGVISDITTPAERGSVVGVFQIGPNVAPSLGPIVGGVLADLAGWRWIFWFLAISSAVTVCLLFLFLPETARYIVGDGSAHAKSILAPSKCLGNRAPRKTNEKRHTSRIRIPNPVKSLYIIFERDSAAIIFTNGIFYMTYCCVQTSLSALFIDYYQLSVLEAGLVYLPFGFGCVLGSYAAGRVMTRDYMRTAKEAEIVIEVSAGDDLSKFPIEKARLRSFKWVAGFSIACLLGYGWTTEKKTSMAAPLVFQFFIGFMITGIFNMCMTLLTDVHHGATSTAQASLNIVRCSLAAGGIAVLQLMLDAIGAGWCFTIISGLCLVTFPLVYAEVKWGAKWRAQRSR